MISPSRQKIIQIDITNSCPHQCANCTRFAGHHQKPFMMSMSQFKQAVDSLRDYPGMVGVMGGEPTMHPQFAEMVDYLVKARPDRAPSSKRYDPIKNFARHLKFLSSSLRYKRGLFTSLGQGYCKSYELIQDSFSYQCINDHSHTGKHLSLLITRKELGVADAEWIKFRDNCWIQNKWSASITPKGAFFCEVAAALDTLFNGPGGWLVEDGWWRREPKDFGEQLDWCEMCSACLPVPRAIAASGRDIVSPAMKERLESIGSQKLRKGLVDTLDLKNYTSSKYKVNYNTVPYLPARDNAVRISSTNQNLAPQKIEAIVVCVGYGDYLAITLPLTKSAVDRVIIVTDEEDYLTQEVCRKHEVEFIISKRLHENGAVFAKGKGINDGISALKYKDWVLLLDADIILPKDFSAKIRTLTLNPGALYYSRRWYFQLFNLRAKVLQKRDKVYVEESDTQEWDGREFAISVFLPGRCKLLPTDVIDVIYLPRGLCQLNFAGAGRRKGSGWIT